MTIAIAMLTLALMAGTGACTAAKNSADTYILTTRLQSPYNRDFTFSTPITIHTPFAALSRNGDVRNAISGILAPSGDGAFSLDITLSEWMSDESNIVETRNAVLRLNEPLSYSSISSVACTRTLTLSKK
jgi:hypothetical protein